MAEQAIVTGSLSAAIATGGWVQLGTQGLPYISFQLQGTFDATVTFYGSVDGKTFIALSVLPIGAVVAGTAVTTSTTEGIWVSTRPTALVFVRAAITTWNSGTANITIAAC
jgi:hypothetical protein